MDIFKLYRNFWDFAFANPEKVKPNHIAIYSFAIEHCNRLGWKEKFGLPASMVLEATGIKSYGTYKKSFDELVEFGFIKVVQYSKNQYSSNIVALSYFDKANAKALDKALSKHMRKHFQSTCESNDSIDIQLYNNTIIPINNILLEKESKENLVDINKNILEQNLTAEKIDSNPPTPFTSKGQKKEKMKFEPNFDFCENSPLKEVLKRWLKYKEWKGQRYKGQDSIETMFKKLNEYSRGDPGVALEIIENAIARNYSGFFKPNEQTQKTTKKNGINEKSTGDKERTFGGFSEPAIKKFFRGE